MTPNEEVRELLSRIWLFSELSEAELGLLAGITQKRRFEARKPVVRQGDVDGDFYCVLRGHLKVTACDKHGHEILMNLLQAGDSFGEIAFFDGQARSATVTSLDACELLVIRRADFWLVMRKAPVIATTLLTALARLVRRLTERAEDSAFLDVRARLAKCLGDLADHHGTRLSQEQVVLRVHLSQQELGDMVQATRESVNKCLREWIKEGIIQRSGRRLVIEDRQRLRDLAAR
jgi:CRP/FNR family transcriptional regulator, cyclic AMP receptor protein